VGWFQGELSSQYQSELAIQKQSQVRSKCNLLLYVLPRNHLKRVNLLPDHTYCIPNVEGNHATLALRFLLSTITKSFSNIYQCKSEECGEKSESAWELTIMRAISSTLFIIYEAKWLFDLYLSPHKLMRGFYFFLINVSQEFSAMSFIW